MEEWGHGEGERGRLRGELWRGEICRIQADGRWFDISEGNMLKY